MLRSCTRKTRKTVPLVSRRLRFAYPSLTGLAAQIPYHFRDMRPSHTHVAKGIEPGGKTVCRSGFERGLWDNGGPTFQSVARAVRAVVRWWTRDRMRAAYGVPDPDADTLSVTTIGGRMPACPTPWTDVAAVNYSNQECRLEFPIDHRATARTARGASISVVRRGFGGKSNSYGASFGSVKHFDKWLHRRSGHGR